MPFLIFGLLAALIGGVASVATNEITKQGNAENVEQTNHSNLQATQETNKTNLQIAQETNAANTAQAELAYQRSKPLSQVADMMQAGMSKSAALNKLAGGGTYSPAMQVGANMQSPHFEGFQAPYMGEQISSIMRQLGDVPANSLQQQSMQESINKTRQDLEFARNEEMRRQESHDFNMWRERYGKRTAELLDGVASKVVQAAAERDYDLSSAKSVQSIMRDLNLESDKDYQSMPHLARTQLFDAIKSQNEQRISQEQHEANLRESEDKHELSILERQKVQDAITEGRAHFNEWKNESNARQKELRVRELAADLQKLRTEIGLADEDANTFLFYVRDHDGNLKKDEIAKQLKTGVEMFDSFWQGFFKIIPLNALSKTLLGDLIKIGI